MKKILRAFFLATISFATCQVALAKLNKESCENQWKHLPSQGSYQFSKYAQPSSQGNLAYQTYAKEVARGECEKDWTVLIYMAADNDLSPYAYWDLHEMEAQVSNQLNLGASTDKVDVVVELDTLRRDGIRRLHMFQASHNYNEKMNLADFDRVTPRFIKSPIVELIMEKEGEEGISSSDRFSQFLQWGVQKYPSKHYMVIIWGHGEGFIGKESSQGDRKLKVGSSDASPVSLLFEENEVSLSPFSDLPNAKIFPLDKPFGGIGFDHSEKSYLSIPEIAQSLKKVNDTFLNRQKIDILAFDACLMQSLEVLSELKESADFLVGSNQIQNYLGMPYRLILDELNLGTSAKSLARRLPQLTKASWESGGYQAQADQDGFETFTMSSLSSWHLKEIVLPELEAFSQVLINYLEEDRYRREELRFLLEKAPRFQGEMIDLGLFYGLVEQLLWREKLSGRESSLSLKLKALAIIATEGIGQSIIDARFGPLYYDAPAGAESAYLLGYFKGLSLWLPKSARLYELRASEMSKSQLHQKLSAWNRVLKHLYVEDIFDLSSL